MHLHATIHTGEKNAYKKIAGEITSAGFSEKEQAAAAKASDVMIKAMIKNLRKTAKGPLWGPRWQGILAAYEAEATKRNIKIK